MNSKLAESQFMKHCSPGSIKELNTTIVFNALVKTKMRTKR